MNPVCATGTSRRSASRRVAWVALLLAGFPAAAAAQTPPPTIAPLGGVAPLGAVTPAVATTPEGAPSGVTQVGCVGCAPLGPPAESGPGIFGYRKLAKHGGPSCGPAGCDLGCVDPGCGEAGCVAGRPGCETCDGGSRLSKMFCAFHNALCCPDPCYEPRWVDAANAAFFVPSVRPTTMTRLRWDAGQRVTQPDRSEFFWAQIGGKGPAGPVSKVDYDELSLYAEVGTPKFSFFIDTPYRSLDWQLTAGGTRGAGSFGDLSLGTKSAIIDSELILSTFQFKTIIPVGVPGRGTGVGHVSLEPSLLYSVKLYTDTYWQGQLAYWIPISATPGFAGGVVQYNNSLNHVLCRPLRDTAFIGTIESTGYTFTAGSYTDPVTGAILRGNRSTYFNIGPGLRMAICDKVDFGVGVLFAVTTDHFAERLFRTELRWRF